MENENIFSKTPFEKASSEELIKAAKNGDARSVSSILIQHGKYLVYDFDQVKTLTMQKAISQVGQTALHWAAKKDYFAIAQILIDHGADVDAKDLVKC